jgi:hypothetical protein
MHSPKSSCNINGNPIASSNLLQSVLCGICTKEEEEEEEEEEEWSFKEVGMNRVFIL